MQPIKVLSVARIDDLADELPHERAHFLLFLAWDHPDISIDATSRSTRKPEKSSLTTQSF